jgi:hypothetical protein
MIKTARPGALPTTRERKVNTWSIRVFWSGAWSDSTGTKEPRFETERCGDSK